jgi:hypothetical protein
MKKWAWVVAALYGLIIVILTAPVLLAAFWDFIKAGSIYTSEDLIEMFSSWPYWSAVALFILAQAALLAVPVKLCGKRPISRRIIMLPVAASALMMGLLVSGLSVAISEAGQGEKFFNGDMWFYIALGILLLTWVFWAAIFYRWSKKLSPANFIEKICHRLFQGSILELLVAVPTHIWARSKNYCCAGLGTFWGIAFGLAVMLFSFGPGVFFLFVQRWEQVHPDKKTL